MPAKSEKQRKFFGAVMGAKKGKGKVKGAAAKVAKKMPKKEIKKFLKKESALTNELNALVENAQPENVFDFAYQHVMSLYLEKLDAVGEEDDDVDNDGDEDETDEYLKARRKKVGAAIGKEEAEESRTPVGGTYPPERSGSTFAWKRKGQTNKKTAPIDREVDAGGLRYNRSIRRSRPGLDSDLTGRYIAKGKEEAEEHMHCKHAEEGCDCDGCEECKANQ